MSSLLFLFDSEVNLSNWSIVDDVVMGGRSNGRLYLNDDGKGVFEGSVSLENNGGFSSTKYKFRKKDVTSFDQITIKIKGDGKRYQIRVKSDIDEDASYIKHFDTNGDWETLAFDFQDLHPTYRGSALSLPNYPGKEMEEVSIMIANKKSEDFKLLLDRIELN